MKTSRKHEGIFQFGVVVLIIAVVAFLTVVTVVAIFSDSTTDTNLPVKRQIEAVDTIDYIHEPVLLSSGQLNQPEIVLQKFSQEKEAIAEVNEPIEVPVNNVSYVGPSLVKSLDQDPFRITDGIFVGPIMESDIHVLNNTRISAYCSCAQCCGIYAENRPTDEYGNEIVYGAYGRLTSGKSIAVNPNVIPYGSYVYIQNAYTGVWEEYRAYDTGGGIVDYNVNTGPVVDLYYSTHEMALNHPHYQFQTVYWSENPIETYKISTDDWILQWIHEDSGEFYPYALYTRTRDMDSIPEGTFIYVQSKADNLWVTYRDRDGNILQDIDYYPTIYYSGTDLSTVINLMFQF